MKSVKLGQQYPQGIATRVVGAWVVVAPPGTLVVFPAAAAVVAEGNAKGTVGTVAVVVAVVWAVARVVAPPPMLLWGRGRGDC